MKSFVLELTPSCLSCRSTARTLPDTRCEAAAPLPLLGALSAPAVRVGLPSNTAHPPWEARQGEIDHRQTPVVLTISSHLRAKAHPSYPQIVLIASDRTSSFRVSRNTREQHLRQRRHGDPRRVRPASAVPQRP
jgi:hypothetical protein